MIHCCIMNYIIIVIIIIIIIFTIIIIIIIFTIIIIIFTIIIIIILFPNTAVAGRIWSALQPVVSAQQSRKRKTIPRTRHFYEDMGCP